MRKIAVINRKGGVGKTTTAANLGHALALRGLRVLLLDLDPQGHLGAHFGVHDLTRPGMDAVLLDGQPLAAHAHEMRPGLHLAVAGPRLAELEQVARGGVERGRRLQGALEAVAGYDLMLFDCAPAAGLLAVNALFAADELLVPMPGDYLAMHGLSQLLRLIGSVERMQERRLETWIALTRFHPRRRLARDARSRLLRYFPGRVLATTVREASPLAEAPGYGQTVFEYRPGSPGAEDYAGLAADLLQRRTMHE